MYTLYIYIKFICVYIINASNDMYAKLPPPSPIDRSSQNIHKYFTTHFQLFATLFAKFSTSFFKRYWHYNDRCCSPTWSDRYQMIVNILQLICNYILNFNLILYSKSYIFYSHRKCIQFMYTIITISNQIINATIFYLTQLIILIFNVKTK